MYEIIHYESPSFLYLGLNFSNIKIPLFIRIGIIFSLWGEKNFLG